MAAYPQYMQFTDGKHQIDSNIFVEVIDHCNMADRFVGLYLNMIKTNKWISEENYGDPTTEKWNMCFPKYSVSYRVEGDERDEGNPMRGNEELFVADSVCGSHVIIIIEPVKGSP